MRGLFLISALMLPTVVEAGAWMRDAGTTFLSFGTTVDEDGDLEGAAYIEHGLRPKLTLGAKIDMSMTEGRMSDGTAYVFARMPIKDADIRFALAYEVGLGSTLGEDASAVVRTGLSYGRGITLWQKSGWIAIDAALEWEVENSVATGKLDSTVGLTLTDRFQVMMQVFYSQTDAEGSTTLAPSVIWWPNPEKSTRYQLGLEAEDGVFAIKLGLWREL